MEEDDSEGRMVENGYCGLRGGGALNVVKIQYPKLGVFCMQYYFSTVVRTQRRRNG